MAKSRRTAGSGGRIRRGLKGRGPTPKAEDRPAHKAYRAKQAQGGQAKAKQSAKPKAGAEWVFGRNPVFEALTEGVPVQGAYVAEGAERDDRMRDILKHCADHSVALLQVTRGELDRLTGGGVHQGVAVKLPAYEYKEVADLIEAGREPGAGPVVVCDHITDPRNLGAIIRSAAAFGSVGVLIPTRRSASMTAVTWKTSAGAAARVPVAQATNLNQALRSFAKAGFQIVGLAGDGDATIEELPGLDGPLVIVVGSEGEGMARLVRENCDQVASIPITSSIESLNASVAAAIALYEVSRRRPKE